jgi:hypothetical protein
VTSLPLARAFTSAGMRGLRSDRADTASPSRERLGHHCHRLGDRLIRGRQVVRLAHPRRARPSVDVYRRPLPGIAVEGAAGADHVVAAAAGVRHRLSAGAAESAGEAAGGRKVEAGHVLAAAGPAEGVRADPGVGCVRGPGRLAAARAVAVEEAGEGQARLEADDAAQASSFDDHGLLLRPVATETLPAPRPPGERGGAPSLSLAPFIWLNGWVKVEVDAGMLFCVTLPDDCEHLCGVVRTILEKHNVEFQENAAGQAASSALPPCSTGSGAFSP